MYAKRLWVCLLGGAIAAVICFLGRQVLLGSPGVDAAALAATIANRILLGFVIGISGWRIHHLVHGAVLGLLLSVSVSVGFLGADLLPFAAYTLAGVASGVMIEWLATDVAKAPMRDDAR